MRAVVIMIVALFVGGMVVWLSLFGYCCMMINDIRSGTRRVHVIRKVIQKYDDCRKLDISVNNVEVFVEKILESEKICGLRLKEWERLAGSFKYIIVLLGIFSGIILKGNTDEIYICVAVAAMCCVGLHFMDRLTDAKGYFKDTVVELVDYLENSGAVRSQAGKVMASKLKGKAASEFVKMNKRYEKICAAKGHLS